MQKEHIEREAVLRIIDKYGCGNGSALGYHSGAVDRAGSEIAQIPSADVVEVRHGKNLSEDDPSRFECSECGWKCWDTYCGDTITYSFCPNCGAKMDMEE